VHDPFVPASHVSHLGAEACGLEELASSSDVITLHVPDLPETHRLVDAAFLDRMRRDAVLVNTSFGAAVETDALADALESGSIAGAALDVFEGHPLPQSSRLMTAPNVILTPHIGGATTETIDRHSRIIADEIERFLDGRALEHVVNPEYQLARIG
jgi:phosphoglycerate dehydrogenase-like enzyme